MTTPVGWFAAAVAAIAGGAYLIYENWGAIKDWFSAQWAEVQAAFDKSWTLGILTALNKFNPVVMLGNAMYGFFAWLFPQVFVDTAEAEFMERWAAVWNITRLDASSAVGSVVLTGNNGAIVTAGTLLINNATQQQYSLDADATIASGQAVAAITAVTAGAAGNCVAGTELSLVAPVSGVLSTCWPETATIPATMYATQTGSWKTALLWVLAVAARRHRTARR